MKTPFKHTSRNVFYLGLVSFFTDLASAMVNPILPLFIVIVLQEGVDKVGLVLAITSIMSYALRFLGGALSDKFDRNKPLLIIGYGLSALLKPLLSLSGGWHSIALIRSGERLGKALRAAPKDKLIALSGPRHHEGRTFGFHKMFDVAGEFSGLLILLCALTYLGTSENIFRHIFLASLLPGLLAIGVLVFFVCDMPADRKKQFSVKFKLDAKLRKPVFVFCLMSAFLFNDAFYVILANERNYPISHILLMLILMRGIQVLLSYNVGKMIDRYSPQHLLSTGYVFGLLALLSLMVPNLSSLVMAFILFGISDVVLLNTIRAKISREAVDKGSAFGSFYFLYAVSTATGLAVLGYVWETYGSQNALIFSISGICLCGAIHLLPGSKRPVKSAE